MHDSTILHCYCPPTEISEKGYCGNKYLYSDFLEAAVDHAFNSHVLQSRGQMITHILWSCSYEVFCFLQISTIGRRGMLCI